MTSTYRAIPKQVTWITRSGTTMLRLQPVGRRNLALPPVIVLHGWPYSLTPATLLDNTLKGPVFPFDQDARAIDVLISTGRTVYRPFTGSNWGTNTTSPSVGGTGLAAIDAAVAQAAADGITATTVDLWGTSMGGLNALNWGWRNEADVHGIFLSNPGFDLDYLYDRDSVTTGWGIGAVSTSLRAVHGGADKASWLPLSEEYDPARQLTEMATIADRCSVFSSRDDEVVPWDDLVTWCDGLGIPLTASAPDGESGGGHLTAPSKAGWHDLLPLSWFHSLG
jgi:pimeloyl-ACP methyl ester carboxylesterase